MIKANLSCYLSSICVSIFLFADDILLVAPTVNGLQLLFNTCERDFEYLDMRVNYNKSMCIRFGPRFDFLCVERLSIHGESLSLKWVDTCRFLGVHFKSGRSFRCRTCDKSKSNFFRAFNAILVEVGRSASEHEVTFCLLFESVASRS